MILTERSADRIEKWTLFPLDNSARSADEWFRSFGGILLILTLLQIVAYNYFYTTISFTNHTFPNTWIYNYPSYKTRGEGRWLADLIILAQGGSGVQSFQMICATLLQSFNGILLARFLGLDSKRCILCMASVLCMFPAFLDYYSYTADHVTFVLGDTFALLGVQAFRKSRMILSRIGLTSLCFLLAIASYQPKVALVSFLALCAVLLRCVKTQAAEMKAVLVRRIICDAIAMFLAMAAALAVYWLTVQFVKTIDLGARTHLNSPREVISEMLAAYPKFLNYCFGGMAGVPRQLRFIPALGIGLGVVVVVRESWRRNKAACFIVLCILALMPISLRAAFVINSQSWEDMGRIVSVNGYCLVCFLGYGLRTGMLRGVTTVVALVCLYFFTVLATQESNAAAFKTAYDMNLINRIVARAETAVGQRNDSEPRALVVVGEYAQFDRAHYVRCPDAAKIAQIQTNAFTSYRQPEILNFYMGRKAFRQPTADELKRAVNSTRDRPAWPSADSVYLCDDILVVVLEFYRPGMSLTWSTD